MKINLKNKKTKNENVGAGLASAHGITLIALVIIIILLIILAGVAISLSLGENGIFSKAKQAKQEYTNAQDYEKTEIGKYTNEIDSIVNNSSRNDTIKKITKKKIGELQYVFTSGKYSQYEMKKTINIKEEYPESYKKFDLNNFSYEISYVYIGTADYRSGDYISSSLNKPILSYDSETGNVSLTIRVCNGYHDYIKNVNSDLYLLVNE